MNRRSFLGMIAMAPAVAHCEPQRTYAQGGVVSGPRMLVGESCSESIVVAAHMAQKWGRDMDRHLSAMVRARHIGKVKP